MKNVDILYGKYMDDDQKTITIGGAQTYITELAKVITDDGGMVRIVRLLNENFLQNGIKVNGFKNY